MPLFSPKGLVPPHRQEPDPVGQKKGPVAEGLPLASQEEEEAEERAQPTRKPNKAYLKRCLQTGVG